jgi:hypothetical protein
MDLQKWIEGALMDHAAMIARTNRMIEELTKEKPMTNAEIHDRDLRTCGLTCKLGGE